MRVKQIQNQIMFVFRPGFGIVVFVALAIAFLAVNRLWPNTRLEENHLNEHTRLEETHFREGLFESGDIVFRRGVGPESQVIMVIDERFEYSHVGIIRKHGSRVEVIHASYGEEGQANETVISEPIEIFLKPTSANAAAVYRLNEQDKSLPLVALSEAERFLKAKTSFDKDFDLDTADRIYCTELIWLAFKKAGVDLTGGKFDRLPFLFGNPNKDYILPSSLLNSSQLQKVWTSQENWENKRISKQ